jgi:hypothetical protein
LFAGVGVGLGDDAADWVTKANVGDDTFTKEATLASEGAIDELVRDDEVGGLVLFLERAYGGGIFMP